MGMMRGLLQRWGRDRNRVLERQVVASDRAATMQSIIQFLRLSMQSLILGLGAYLVIERLDHRRRDVRRQHPARPRAAAGRADRRRLAQHGLGARRLSSGVKTCSPATPVRDPALALPRPTGRLSVEGLALWPPAQSQQADPARHLVPARRRRGARRHRPVRCRQIDAGASDRRRAGALRRRGAPRWRRRLDLAARIARPPSRLSAAGHRAVRRHGRGQHQPLPQPRTTTTR